MVQLADAQVERGQARKAAEGARDGYSAIGAERVATQTELRQASEGGEGGLERGGTCCADAVGSQDATIL